MQAVERKLSNFLEENESIFACHWRKSVKIANNDIYKDMVHSNGIAMYRLVIRLFRGELSDNEIETLACKVAKERAEGNINIAEFVFNVNKGRTEIFKHLNSSNIPTEALQPVINKLNDCFDLFIYHAITEYNNLINKANEEKQAFINQRHKDRLTILGQMSSSFVHEFRNQLTAIMGFVKLLKVDYPNLKYIDVIERELAQLNYRISQFLLVSKKGAIEYKKEVFSINEMFEEIEDFLYPSMVDGDVGISTSIDPQLFVKGSREELRQVFINVIINSIDALQQIERERKIIVDIHEKGEQIEIHISNNGPVIPPETKESIFEPFMTTKKLGTGIGLYICKKIIENHQGEISCSSDETLTTFSINLPKA